MTFEEGIKYDNKVNRERFLLEATVSLPTLVEEPAPADIYQAMLHQRARLKADQQLAEWTFGR
jgi:hypothetical protein